MIARTTSVSCTNCTRGSNPNTQGTAGRPRARLMGVTMSSPSTFENRSMLTVVSGLSAA